MDVLHDSRFAGAEQDVVEQKSADSHQRHRRQPAKMLNDHVGDASQIG